MNSFGESIQPEKRSRLRDSLGSRSNTNRYVGVTSQNHMLGGGSKSYGNSSGSDVGRKIRTNRASSAAAAMQLQRKLHTRDRSQKLDTDSDTNDEIERFEEEEKEEEEIAAAAVPHQPVRKKNNRMGNGLELSRRHSIRYLFEYVLGNPPEDEWNGENGTVKFLMRTLWIPDGSRTVVVRVMREVAASIASGDEWDPNNGIRKRGAKLLIEENTATATLIYRSLEQGLSLIHISEPTRPY